MSALDQAWEIIKREFDAASSQAARAARGQLASDLNQILRRLRRYETENEWVSTVLDGASLFVQQLAVFGVANGVVTLRGERKLGLPGNLSFPATAAAAFSSAIATGDTVIALRTAAEVTEALSSTDPGERAHITPIANANRVAAVLYTVDKDYVDINGIELIAGLASAVLERHSNVTLHTRIRASMEEAEREISIGAAPSKVEEIAPLISPNGSDGTSGVATRTGRSGLPPWADLSEEQRSLHIRAQRFSRVAVAEMQLGRREACRAGREQSNLYLFLKKEIDAARDTYRNQFMTIPSMVDYLHLELVSVAAEGDETKLGAEYPGQLA